jgi:hypothetical protein
MVTSERPMVATPRKNRPKYLPSRSSIVSQGVMARLAQPARVASAASEHATCRLADRSARVPMVAISAI